MLLYNQNKVVGARLHEPRWVGTALSGPSPANLMYQKVNKVPRNKTKYVNIRKDFKGYTSPY